MRGDAGMEARGREKLCGLERRLRRSCMSKGNGWESREGLKKHFYGSPLMSLRE